MPKPMPMPPRLVDYSDFIDDITDGVLSRDRVDAIASLGFSNLMADASVRGALVFHAAWRAALEVPPCKPDVLFFVEQARRPSGEVRFFDAAVWEPALRETLIARSPIRVMANAAALVTKAVDSYRRTAAALASDRVGVAVVGRMLKDKLVARFCGEGSPVAEPQRTIVDGATAIDMYIELVANDPAARLLEAWAAQTTTERSVSDSVSSRYYDRVEAACRELGLPTLSILTGKIVQGQDVVARVSAIEAVRAAMMRDLSLWRSDVGGTLVVPGADAPLSESPPESAAACARLLHPGIRSVPPGVPAGLVVRAAPPVGLYARMAVVDDADAFHLAQERLVGVDVCHVVTAVVGAAVGSTAAAVGSTVVVGGVPTDAPPGSAWVPSPSSPLSVVWKDVLGAQLCGAPGGGGPAGLAQACGQHAGLRVFHQYVVREAHARGLMTKTFVAPRRARDDGCASEGGGEGGGGGGGGVCGTVVAVDTRENWWTLLCLLLSLDNLDNRRWNVVYFCAASNEAWVRRELLARVPHARVVVSDTLSRGKFTMDTYNELLMSRAFWEHDAFVGIDRVLTVQDDCALMRRGLEDDAELMAQAYVGAPWVGLAGGAAANAATLVTAGVPAEALVGNGGLSLRSRAAMVRVIDDDARCGRRFSRALFYHNLVPVPEDVFFASGLARLDPPLSCPLAVAERFAFEEYDPTRSGGARPFGFHKPWAYLPAEALRRVLLPDDA